MPRLWFGPWLTYERQLIGVSLAVFLSPSPSLQDKSLNILFFLRFYLFIFRQKGREGEKHQCVVASHAPPHWGPQPTHVP